MLDMRFRHIAFGFAMGAGIGAGGAYAYLKRTSPPSAPAPMPSLPAGLNTGADEFSIFREHPAFKYGIPQTDSLRIFDGYVTSYDGRTRNPKWVLEVVTRESLQGGGTRESSSFFEDPGLEPRFRAKLDDYMGSGYDRGHMAPAANHRRSQKAMDDTFCLSNISPQVGPGFNRDYWARFEKMVKDTARNADSVHIVTGPLWLPQPDGAGRGGWEMRHPMIGKPPQLLAVPTHFYKVVLAENSSGQHGTQRAALGAFVMPNAAIDPATPVTAFAVPLDALEAVAGTRFFPGFVNERRRAALDAAALGWQAEGRARMRVLERLTLASDQAALLPKQIGEASAASPGKQQQQQPPLAETSGLQRRQPKTVNGEGAVHLCDLIACSLPAERWWEGGNGGSGGRGSSGGGNRSSGVSGGRGRGRPRGGGGPGPAVGLQEAAALAEAPPTATADATGADEAA